MIPIIRTSDTVQHYWITQKEVDHIKATEWWWYECTTSTTNNVLVSMPKKSPTTG